MIDTNEFTKVVHGEVRNGVIRRRHWCEEDKGRIVAEAIAPGAVIAAVAHRHDLTPQHLSNWIRAAKKGLITLPGETLSFVPIAAEEASVKSQSSSQADGIEIVIGTAVIRVPAGSDTRTLEKVVRAVARAFA